MEPTAEQKRQSVCILLRDRLVSIFDKHLADRDTKIYHLGTALAASQAECEELRKDVVWAARHGAEVSPHDVDEGWSLITTNYGRRFGEDDEVLAAVRQAREKGE